MGSQGFAEFACVARVASNSTAGEGIVELAMEVAEIHWERKERRELVEVAENHWERKERRELAEVEEVAEVEELHPQRSSSSPESATKKIEAQLVHSEKSTTVNQS